MRRIFLGRGLGDGKLEAVLRDLDGEAALACTGEGEHTWAYIRREGETTWHVTCGLPPDTGQDAFTAACGKPHITEWEAGLAAAFTLEGNGAQAAECLRWLFAQVADLNTIRLTIE